MDDKEFLFLKPYFSHTIWGGNKLRTVFGYDEPGDDIGECWGISAHPSGECIVLNGPYKGMKLSDVWNDYPMLFGKKDNKGIKFPLLTKIIDARDDLSIQVHPDDEYANKNENGSFGKTECWYILDCDENARIIIGHNATSKEELCSMIDEGKWDELIRLVPIHKGDFLQINPGTVHAIKGGTTLLETQQSSDITYRLYDYDRLQNGKKRPLHLSQSKDVITVPAALVDECIIRASKTPENTLYKLYGCKFYKVYKIDITQNTTIDKVDDYMLISVINGEGSVNGQKIKMGDHFIATKEVDKLSFAGKMNIIASAE